MKKQSKLKIALTIILGLMFITSNVKSQNYPSIKIDGNEVLISDISKFPYWLTAGQTLDIGSNVYAISVLQYYISPAAGGGNDLLFESVLNITSLQTVPIGKAWKVESVGLDMSAAVAGATGATGPQGPIGNDGATGPTGSYRSCWQ